MTSQHTPSGALSDTTGVPRHPINAAPFTQPYWDGTRDRRLLVQYCADVDRYQYFALPTNLYTSHERPQWREVEPVGELFSYTITERAPAGSFRDQEPYAVAVVTLDIGVRVMGNLIHCERADIRIGMRLSGHWLPNPDGTNLLMFEPAESKSA
jgi:uncharacterized protein